MRSSVLKAGLAMIQIAGLCLALLAAANPSLHGWLHHGPDHHEPGCSSHDHPSDGEGQAEKDHDCLVTRLVEGHLLEAIPVHDLVMDLPDSEGLRLHSILQPVSDFLLRVPRLRGPPLAS